MKEIEIIPLHNLQVEINKFAHFFSKKYFGKDIEEWWVGDDIGGVYYINDRFFNLNDMMDFIRYGYSGKKMFEYYDYAFEENIEEGRKPICIRDYKKLKK